MITIYNEIIYRPLVNVMAFLLNIIPGHDLGLAIIVLTLAIRLVFYPLSRKTIRSQQMMRDLAPQVEVIKEKFKNDPAAQYAAINQLYKDNNVSLFSGCLPLLIQIPFLFALYHVFINGINGESMSMLYSFVKAPENINSMLFGVIDLNHRNIGLTILAGLAQFWQAKKTSSLQANTGANKEMAALNKQMLYFFPAMIIIIGWNLPAGLILYWITTTLFSVLEQHLNGRNGK